LIDWKIVYWNGGWEFWINLLGAVTDSPFQAIVMAQTEHFTAGGNPDSHVQGKKLHWLSLPAFLSRKKKKKVLRVYVYFYTKAIFILLSSLLNKAISCPKKVVQLAGTTPNKTEVTSLNLPPSCVDMSK
jgi:hypothetical protein